MPTVHALHGSVNQSQPGFQFFDPRGMDFVWQVGSPIARIALYIK